jgi:uncharacterized membrane protein YphA (DoxX/SURF4 family)
MGSSGNELRYRRMCRDELLSLYRGSRIGGSREIVAMELASPADGTKRMLIRAAQGTYGLCLVTSGILQLYYGDFRTQILPPWPSWFPAPAVCARAMGLALVASGVAVLINRCARTISLFWAGLFLAFVPVLHVPYMFLAGPNARHLGNWGDTINTLALAGMALVVAGSFSEGNSIARDKPALTRILENAIPFGRILYCAPIIGFGICHFLYAKYIDTLIPVWIPWHRFWTYFAGTCLIGSGTAIVLKIRLRLVAFLLGTMIFLWVLIIHIPRAISDPHSNEGNEIESAARALAESGTAFLLAWAPGRIKNATESHRSRSSQTVEFAAAAQED